MLVLSRKVGERIQIGENITVVVSRISGNRITLGIDAPRDIRIIRGELKPLVEQFEGQAGQFEDQVGRFENPTKPVLERSVVTPASAPVTVRISPETVECSPRRAR